LPWHARHVAADDAFAVSENVLTLHRLHALAPIDGLYLPAPHAKQGVAAPPPGPVYPGAHLHAVTSVLPFTDVVNGGHALQYADADTSMYVSTGQDTHGAVPFVALYLPSAHAAHGPPSAPSYPALHEQFVTSVAARSGS
jgi:hypothetical protein